MMLELHNSMDDQHTGFILYSDRLRYHTNAIKVLFQVQGQETDTMLTHYIVRLKPYSLLCRYRAYPPSFLLWNHWVFGISIPLLTFYIASLVSSKAFNIVSLYKGLCCRNASMSTCCHYLETVVGYCSLVP